MSAEPSPDAYRERRDASGGSFSFAAMEHEIIERWEKLDIFRQSLANTRDKQPYVFYDGPPFATGLPHHGHILGSTLKDVVPRYWTMKGRYVDRRFGWDCHGLPIEQEIDKSLGMSAAEAVAKFGVAGYNDRCRAIVERYVAEWRKTITRLGRWVDFDNDYKTMDAWYMESVWWVVKQLWDKGLIYRGFKVMPVSTSLQTVLANFEAGLNYLDVTDPAVTVLFKLQDEDAYLAAWTTTPWTLPSNLAICAHADIDYVKVRDTEGDKTIYLAAGRLEHYRSRHPELEVVSSLKGRDLEGRTYEPLFDYFDEERSRGAFQVVLDDYVTADEGTGLVHQAPAFGEDDHRVLRAAGIDAFACPVTMAGVFTEEVRDFAGQYVKDADPGITRHLKASGSLYDEAVINHSYPYCWRSDTPLIYRAVPSWFVRVTDIADKLVAANEQVHWVPGHLKQGRMGNWLRGAIDWAISRNRVWGTPLPLWENDVTGKVALPGFRRGTRRADGSDRHRPAPRACGRPHLHRGRRGGCLSPRGRGAGLLVRVRFHAVCAVALSLREPQGVRRRVPGGVHRGRPGPNPRLVLHPAGAGRCAVRPAGVSQCHRPRHGAGCGRQEDVQEPAQLHAAGRTHGDLRRRTRCGSI